MKQKILIVDDHSVVREGLRGLIDRQPDLQVSAEAANVAEALSACEDSRPDGVIIDLALGKESGLDLVQRVREKNRDLPILVLSMHSETIYAERAIRSGANGYVMKEEATAQLLEALRLVLRGSMFVSPRVADRMLRSFSPHSAEKEAFGVDRLSDRELEVFRLVGMGLGTAQIAERLHIAQKTVETHRARIKEKLGVETANELVVQAATWVNEFAVPGRRTSN